MTKTTTPPAAPQWSEENFRAFLRRLKPYTPELRAKLTRVVVVTDFYKAACLHYQRTGDARFLREVLPAMDEARRAALIAAGEDPNSTHLLPATPLIPFNN